MEKKNKQICRIVLGILITFVVTAMPAVASEYDKLLKKYKKEITTKKSSLEEIEKQLGQKKSEKLKYEREEQLIRKELARIERETSKINNEITKIQKEIRSTKKKLANTEKEMNLAKMEAGQWKNVLKKELDRIYKDYYSVDFYMQDVWVKSMSLYALKVKTRQIGLASDRENYAKGVFQKYTKIQEDLDELNKDLIQKQSQQEAMKKDKAELYKTARGIRISVEEEIKKLNETSLELKQFIESLEKRKDETAQQKQQEEYAKKSFIEKKKSFKWPVSGKVITKYGKNKHAEFDTYVISNGIKIQAQTGAQITAIDKGEVVYAKTFRSYGNTVIVDHGGGIYSIYGQLNEILVDNDAQIKSGDVVGKLGKSGNNTLYFEISVNGQPQDPLEWLQK
ncbi:MAG: hypothetical protein A2252_11055 [Elusimicrobia bacterium RIFOXYA2_FULL_39_19]|nr:MAG: hypothetical protein A2252_11055 [Elusimicrobia bacterium RIFOXYA2_FULL_39_19]